MKIMPLKCTGGVGHKNKKKPDTFLKSVQSALSDLKRPPERLQSQCNYRPFIT